MKIIKLVPSELLVNTKTKNRDHKKETFDLQVSKILPINHTLKHKGMEFPCFKCSFKSTTKLQLRYHYQIEHKENKKSS